MLQAVAGLPDPRKDHAVIIAKFAADCLTHMDQVTGDLVLALGPDTIDLKLRVGLHSGPVVAGVLRGDKSRFQLFGDTMNTASRMESTGIANMIQASQETADLLIAAGKKHWLTKRKDPVSAKGKGEMVTYFVRREIIGSGHTTDIPASAGDHSSQSDSASQRSLGCDGSDKAPTSPCICKWTVEVMAGLLREIVASRAGSADGPTGTSRARLAALEREVTRRSQEGGTTVIDEVQEIIEIPDSHSQSFKPSTNLPNDVKLKSKVLHELRDYVREVALMHNDNRT
jgi:Adenylate and Guanylate cyclase catalytic domain